MSKKKNRFDVVNFRLWQKTSLSYAHYQCSTDPLNILLLKKIRVGVSNRVGDYLIEQTDNLLLRGIHELVALKLFKNYV